MPLAQTWLHWCECIVAGEETWRRSTVTVCQAHGPVLIVMALECLGPGQSRKKQLRCTVNA